VVVATALLHIRLPIADDILKREPYRFIMIFKREDQAWKIAYSGASIPYHLAESQPSEVYPVHELEVRNRELESLVGERTSAMEKALHALEVLSATDELTGLANRRAFNRALRQEWSRAQRAHTPLCLLMIDIDYFKHYNDRYGHQAGDRCLKAIARAVAQSVHRTGEVAARYGGEELAVLLPNANEYDAYMCGCRMQRSLRQLKLSHEGVPAQMVTLSIGAACLIPSVENTPHKLIGRADLALYQAKDAGRNCLRFYRKPGDQIRDGMAKLGPAGDVPDSQIHRES
jgi:diguanylate cyclase (GGDEF)-like protein